MATTGTKHEVTPSVVLMAVKMLIRVWIRNFQVSFLVIVLRPSRPPLKGGDPTVEGEAVREPLT